MRVLIFHGYLLRGTGSNVYNANLAQALARLGHDVHLLCQDLQAAALPWVDAVGRWEEGELAVERTGHVTPAESESESERGSTTAYLPDIGGVLPTYVADSYDGFRALTFPELTDEEIETYIAANVAAIADVVARTRGVEAALANHLVMGPAILARSGLPFAAKVHGSALSYTVMPHPRFLPYAREGVDAAEAILVGSRHTAEALWRTLGDPGLRDKTRLGPPGVDVEAFSPLPARSAARTELEGLADELDPASEGAAIAGDGFGRDGAGAAAALRSYAEAEGPRVIFVGKLIVSKGCDLLLAAWPLVVREHPGARLLIIGFGSYREALGRLWAALVGGDFDEAREIAAQGRALESGGETGTLAYLDAFLTRLPDGYAEAARAAEGSIDLAGRLEYGEVAHAVRASDAMVVPSTFPEAFGMVAAEAAATGALPVCARHSGLAEVAERLSEALGEELGWLTSFEPGPEAVAEIADRLNGWLALGPADREAAGSSLAAAVRARWSWEGVATAVLAASAGELIDLDPVPSG
ncbi:MAG: glycosyltransferase family 4 protein [Solirubrobacterales bacterium]|nr:glycosyltransferase family 4 protein [Solirubrobacterales bacterium]